jgi:hypothetical protein
MHVLEEKTLLMASLKQLEFVSLMVTFFVSEQMH